MDENDTSTYIRIGDADYELVLTTRATKLIGTRYGGLENLGEQLTKSENFEQALEEIVWLITMLANQSVCIYNLWHEDKKPVLTEEIVELMTTPYDLAMYKNAILACMYKGAKRNIVSEDTGEKNLTDG